MASDTSTQAIRTNMQRRGGHPGKIEKAHNPRQALAHLARYLRPYGWALAGVTGFILVYSLLGLAGPYLMGLAIDRYIAARDVPALLRTALLMLAVYTAANGFQIAANWIMAQVSQRSLQRLRGDLFGHLQTLPLSFFDTRPAGGLMSRLTSDIDAINQTVSQNVTTLIAGVVSMTGILAAMLLLNHWLALASLVVIPIMFGFTRFVAAYTRKGFRELQQKIGELNDVSEEAISGQRVTMAFRRNSSTIEAFRAKNQAVYRASVFANTYAMLLMPLTGVLGNFFVIVLAGAGGWLALKGLVSVGIIATFINYAQNFISPLRQLANLFNSIQSALAGAERVFEIIDIAPETDLAVPTETPPAVRGAVRFSDVAFSYTPGTRIIQDFTLDVLPGQTIALVGPTGAGKTTIINLLSRFYEIESGSISIDGTDIRQLPKEFLRRRLGLVLQDTFLFAGSVRENIRYGRLEAGDEECAQAARLAEAEHFILQLPEGYDTQLSERATNLSQGQRQLLSITRAILADPAILILDEATSSVDTRTELRIQQALLRLMRGRTSFVIAHRLSTIRDADKVVVIDRGRIVEQGTHQELLDLKGFYHRLYVSQFKGNQI